MTDNDELGEQTPHCETCGVEVGDGVSYYKGVYYAAYHDDPVKELYFCSIPCMTQNAYSQVETVELPGGAD